jgi:chemotaxis protein CheD
MEDPGGVKMEHEFLVPGGFFVTDKSVIVETVVGSGVSVCLYNVKSGEAAINHFLQDVPRAKEKVDIGQNGLTSTEHIINVLIARDPVPDHYVAQIFGGADLVEKGQAGSDIGRKNVQIARQILNAHRIRIIREEMGGKRGRCIRFNTATNTVFCEFTDRLEHQSCAQ